MIIFARQYQRTDATIDPSDNSGNIFLTKMFTETPSLIEYIDKARTGREYDFKVTNGTPKPIENINKYRGMPVSIPGENSSIYTSARDIGNIAAGYVVGVNGFNWVDSRIAFDAYQSYTSSKFEKEDISTQNAEFYGWRIGYKNAPMFKKEIINWIKSPIINF